MKNHDFYLVQSYKNISSFQSLLKSLLIKKRATDPGTSIQHFNSFYYGQYFKIIDVRTLLAERDYLDRTYLEDFSGYYVKCFEKYQRRCDRIHFFKNEFDEEWLLEVLISRDTSRIKELKKNYLGYMIIKPLPRTIVGKTCLVTYPSLNGQRNYPTIRKYQLSLFGIELKIRSLAFQEQDNVVAACATTSLWSLFQKTGVLYQHSFPSLIEITKTATKTSPIYTKTLPNTEGLDIFHMAEAIRSVNLGPYYISAENCSLFKDTLYAYIKSGIPAILTVSLCNDEISKSGRVKCLGVHSVTITGYRLSNAVDYKIGSSYYLSKAVICNLKVSHYCKVKLSHSPVRKIA